MRRIAGFDALREQGKMTWIEQERGWIAVLEDILTALSTEGFEECKRTMTTSRRDLRPSGGVWQGINPHTGSVASAIWVSRRAWRQATIFIDIDGKTFEGDHADLRISGDAVGPSAP